MIRRAVKRDATAIAAVNNAVWVNEAAQMEHVTAALDMDGHIGHVAFVDERVVGFVDGFITHAQEGTPRWELNLLAVLPQYRGRGIAAQLVEANTDAGKSLGTVFSRGLVRVDNAASQRTFARCGYTAGDLHELYVSTEDYPQAVQTPTNARLLDVFTMTYRGVWIEGALTLETFQAAQRRRMTQGGLIAGAVIPLSNSQGISAAIEAGYELVGRYQWWVKQNG